MNHYEAFHRLGIPVTKDPAAVKEAYQRLAPRHHPEEDPQGFMQLHQAYKAALAYTKGSSVPVSSTSQWQPAFSPADEPKTGYDSLFSGLEETRTLTPTPEDKKRFSRKITMLKLHWLPIPAKKWQKFFDSEEYLLCRREPDCLEKLWELLKRKIHTFPVLRLLINRLWELHDWQKSEGLEALSVETRNCMNILREQYSHYRKRNPAALKTKLLYAPLWYYQALPFYFKLPVSTFLLPLFSFGSDQLLVLVMLGFYAYEIYLWLWKSARMLGIFYPRYRMRKGILKNVAAGNSGWLIILTVYALLMHAAFCIAFFETFLN